MASDSGADKEDFPRAVAKGEPIRVGVVGVGRGRSFADGATGHVGMKLVALCDVLEERLSEAGDHYGVATYTDFDHFLEHDMDAIVLANYFNEHAPFAMRALAAGKHVMSETAACKTLAEGVALCRAVEESGCTYMFAENYPYSAANQELRRLYRAGEVGDVRYAEGEYNHPGDESWRLSISPGLDHWRNWLPPTYYCSHALSPLMFITDTAPASVNGLSIVEDRTQSPRTTKVSDVGSVLLVRMDNGAVFRIWGLMLSSVHRVKFEVHGDRGYIATADPDHWATVRIHHEPWLCTPERLGDRTYTPGWPAYGELADGAGHGGGDFWMNLQFADAIRTGESPYLDVYRGVSMAAVGILGWRSCLEHGVPQGVPDFRDEAARRIVEDDHWSPFPGDAVPGQPPPSIRGYIAPGGKAQAEARAVWAEQGYDDV